MCILVITALSLLQREPVGCSPFDLASVFHPDTSIPSGYAFPPISGTSWTQSARSLS